MTPRPSRHKRFMEGQMNSNTSSRSGSRTPVPDGEESEGIDVNFHNLEEVLASKLESSLSVSGYDKSMSINEQLSDSKQREASKANEARIHAGLASVNEIIFSLGRSRTEVSSQSRELLLGYLYRNIVSKPLIVYNEENAGSSRYISVGSVELLIKLLMTGEYRSSFEFLYLFRSCIALLASDIEEFSELMSPQLFGKIESLVLEASNPYVTNANKASVVTGYAGLLMIFYNGSSGYGIENKVHWFMEIAEGYFGASKSLNEQIRSGDREHSTNLTDESEDKRIVEESLVQASSESAVAIAALHAAGCMVTLMSRSNYLNDFVSELVRKALTFCEEEDLEIAKAAGRLIALCYESYTYENEEENQNDDPEFNYNAPYYEQAELLATIERLASVSTPKISKKNKKEMHSIFRDVANSITTYTDFEKRMAILKGSALGVELKDSLIKSSYLKLSKTKSLHINNWFLYFRLIHSKFCFGYGVQGQLISNESIREVMREPPSHFQERYGNNENEGDVFQGPDESPGGKIFEEDDRKRTEKIRKARLEKLTEQTPEILD